MLNIPEKLSTIKPKVAGVTVVTIDGHSGSGKSTLAKLLSEKLNAEIIHTDDFATWDNTLDWWPNVVEKVFNPIALGANSLSYQPTSCLKDQHPEPVVDQPVTDIMVVEGMSSSRREFDDYISFRIFVDTPKALCITRGVARDAGYGKSKEELTMLWEKWLGEEDEYFRDDNPKTKTDSIIDGTKPFEEQISF